MALYRFRTAVRAVGLLVPLCVGAAGVRAAGVAPATGATMPAQTCSSIAAYHRLDFWLGSWTVYDAHGAKAGHDVVRSILRGCAITEDWTDVNGSRGLGILHYDIFANQWRKLYLTDASNLRGGIRERVLVAAYANGGVRFEGTIGGRGNAPPILNRVTITPLPNGRIRYLVSNSKDGGDHWIDAFDASYVKDRPAG